MSFRSDHLTHAQVRPRSRGVALALVLPALLLGGCSDSDDPAGPPEDEGPAEVTVNAATEWAYVGFDGNGPRFIPVTDPSSSTAWDLAFRATSVMLNGGDAGPGELEAYCVCNGAGTEAEVLAITADQGLDAFLEVTAAQIPTSDDAWESDDLIPAMDGWWSYDVTTHTVTLDTGSTWVVRTSEGIWAVLRFTDMEGNTQAHAGQVTLDYALQPAAGAPLEAVRSVTLDVTAGEVSLDLDTGDTTGGEDWDLRLDGYTIRVNGGVSGSGGAGAVRADEPFDSVMNPSEVPSSALRGDTFGGVFNGATEDRWYRYNLQGNHQIWPTYHVYLVRRGSEVHKVQVAGYYGADGTPRQITVRHAPLDP